MLSPAMSRSPRASSWRGKLEETASTSGELPKSDFIRLQLEARLKMPEWTHATMEAIEEVMIAMSTWRANGGSRDEVEVFLDILKKLEKIAPEQCVELSDDTAEKLGELGTDDKRAIVDLIFSEHMLDDPIPEVRWRCAHALGQLGQALKGLSENDLGSLCHAFAHDSAWQVRYHALRAYCKTKFLKGKRGGVEVCIDEAITILRCVEDEHWLVQEAAAFTLRTALHKKVVMPDYKDIGLEEVVKRELGKEDADYKLREHLSHILIYMDHIQRTKDQAAKQRTSDAEQLDEIVTTLLKDSWFETRANAVQAFAQFGQLGQEQASHLAVALFDTSPVVREAAKDVLEMMGHTAGLAIAQKLVEAAPGSLERFQMMTAWDLVQGHLVPLTTRACFLAEWAEAEAARETISDKVPVLPMPLYGFECMEVVKSDNARNPLRFPFAVVRKDGRELFIIFLSEADPWEWHRLMPNGPKSIKFVKEALLNVDKSIWESVCSSMSCVREILSNTKLDGGNLVFCGHGWGGIPATCAALIVARGEILFPSGLREVFEPQGVVEVNVVAFGSPVFISTGSGEPQDPAHQRVLEARKLLHRQRTVTGQPLSFKSWALARDPVPVFLGPDFPTFFESAQASGGWLFSSRFANLINSFAGEDKEACKNFEHLGVVSQLYEHRDAVTASDPAPDPGPGPGLGLQGAGDRTGAGAFDESSHEIYRYSQAFIEDRAIFEVSLLMHNFMENISQQRNEEILPSFFKAWVDFTKAAQRDPDLLAMADEG